MKILKSNAFRLALALFLTLIALGIAISIPITIENFKSEIRRQYFEINCHYPKESFSMGTKYRIDALSRAEEYEKLREQLLEENQHKWHTFITQDIIYDVSRNMYDVYCSHALSAAE